MSDDIIQLGHGAGGVLMRRLVADVFARHFDNEALRALDDAATLELPPGRAAFTTDAYVVKPLEFPGGDIGKLAVCGTVNDLAVMGAEPRYLSAAFTLEEGLPLATLDRIAASMAAAAREAGVEIVCGDTKVVARGEADGLFITTAGVGVYGGREPLRRPLEPGDAVVLSGSVGDHGVAVMLAREQFKFDAAVESDCAPLGDLCRAMREAAPGIKFMRDPTRGGLAAALNEAAEGHGVGLEIAEEKIPVKGDVAAVCEILGLDPLYVANEGKVVAVAPVAEAEGLVRAMRGHAFGAGAEIIGRVVAEPKRVFVKTVVGGTRVLGMPLADQLPRIC
ncbi:MAG: hydrogenase expression/formation protein HypE [Candidatus Zixiibacteriota bacterium]|jgi:hydrogenase expression/formation protein HypE